MKNFWIIEDFWKSMSASVFIGAFFCVLWFGLAFFDADFVLFGAKIVWAIFVFCAFCIFMLLINAKQKICFVIFTILAFGVCFGIGKIIGLDFLPAMNVHSGLELHPQCWLLFPLIGILSLSLLGVVPMLFFLVDGEVNIKKRWILSGQVFGCIAAFGLTLWIGGMLISLI